MKKLYLKPWDYNCALLMDAIEKIVLGRGGELKGFYTPGEIYGYEASFDAVKTNHCDVFGHSITFVLDGYYYYLELDDNPFFDFHSHKIPLTKCACGKFYVDDFTKDCFPDSMLRYNETNLNEVARKVLDRLTSMKDSEMYTHNGKTEIIERKALSV